MNRFGNLFPILYFLVGFAHIIGIIWSYEAVLAVSKPLLMPILLLFMLTSIWPKLSFFASCILLGLVFSLGGDVFMMLQGKEGYIDKPMFLYGLGSFLITHLFYLISFYWYPSGEKGYVRVFPKTIFPFLLFFIWINYYLWDDLGEMRIPVMVYSGVISIMAIAALNLSERMDPKAFRLIFTGVLLFMFSDLVIALARFRGHELYIPYPRVIIMAIYILAQYYIVKGAIRANYLIPEDLKT